MFNPANYTSVSFWIYGGIGGANGLRLSCLNSGGGVIKSITIPNVPVNTWVQQTVPMSSLAGTTPFISVEILNYSSTTLTFYLDDIQLNT